MTAATECATFAGTVGIPAKPGENVGAVRAGAEELKDQPASRALDRSTELAYNRTWLAEERTILAWVRTATSLITFGFAIYSFFVMPNGAGHARSTYLGPRIFAVALIGVGLAALLAAAVQRYQAVKAMKLAFPGLSRLSMGEIVGLLVGLLGLLALILILSRI
jgi:putative membrane protein